MPDPGDIALSIVVPTHDTRELTLACLASLPWEEGPEVVVVDDASKDGTGEAIRHRFPKARVLRNETARGFTAAVNLGIEASRGRLVLLLNSDTVVPEGTLSGFRRALAGTPRLGIAGARLLFPDGRDQWSGGREPNLLWFLAMVTGAGRLVGRSLAGLRPTPSTEAELRRVDWVSGAAMMVRRQVFREIGSFDERFFLYAQDLDLCLRARDAGWRVAVLTSCPVLHHQGGTTGRVRPAASIHRQDIERKWVDLLRWAEKRRGRRWAKRVATVLALGARCRVAGCRLALPFLRPDSRSAARATLRAHREALSVLRGPLPGPHRPLPDEPPAG